MTIVNFEKIKDKKNELTIEIYLMIIYVILSFISDPENPFTYRHYFDIPMYPNHIKMYYDSRGIIPCGVSDPEYNVTLKTIAYNTRYFGPEDDVLFDPMLGFVIRRVTSEFDGLFECIAEVENTTYVRSFTILIEGK